jgi:hypothetical protein
MPKVWCATLVAGPEETHVTLRGFLLRPNQPPSAAFCNTCCCLLACVQCNGRLSIVASELLRIRLSGAALPNQWKGSLTRLSGDLRCSVYKPRPIAGALGQASRLTDWRDCYANLLTAALACLLLLFFPTSLCFYCLLWHTYSEVLAASLHHVAPRNQHARQTP